MVRPFTVSGTRYRGGGAAAGRRHHPAGGLRLRALAAVDGGSHTFLVENVGPQPHELVVVKLAPGKTIQDFAAWAESLKGPPPAAPVGGVAGLDKGLTAHFTVDLTPGEYGMICFVPDAKDGKPHLVHGMMKQFKVES